MTAKDTSRTGAAAAAKRKRLSTADQDWKPEIVSARDTPERVSILILGTWGAGKTWAAGSLSGELKTLFINTDGHVEELRHNFPNADVIEIPDDDIDAETAQPLAFRRLSETIRWLLAEPQDYAVYILDCLTPTVRWSISYAMFLKGKHILDDISQPDFGSSQMQLLNLLRLFRRLPGINIVNAHVREEFVSQPDERTRKNFVPAVIGQMQTTLGQGFSEIWFATRTPAGKYVLRTERSDDFGARTALGLPDGMSNDLTKTLLPRLKGGSE